MTNVIVMADAPVREIKENGVVIEKDGSAQFIEADTVVLATGFLWDDTLYEGVKELAPEVYALGVSVVDSHMIHGIYEAFELAMKI